MLEEMGLKAGPVVCATDPGIARLKPDLAGLLAILRQTGVAPERALMIGDRFDRDAAAAGRAGMRALIRSGQPHAQWATFQAYDDPVFQPLLPGATGQAGTEAAGIDASRACRAACFMHKNVL